MTLIARMADTTDPWEIPTIFRVKPNGVAAYVDGEFAWPEGQLRLFPRHIGITVTGIPAMAQHARVIDVERFDATPADVPPFLENRAKLGHPDGEVYCDRSTVAEVLAAIEGRQPEPWWWIATLDNHPWTPGELAADIRDNYGADIAPQRIRAIQCYPGGHFDTSLCYGQTWAR